MPIHKLIRTVSCTCLVVCSAELVFEWFVGMSYRSFGSYISSIGRWSRILGCKGMQEINHQNDNVEHVHELLRIWTWFVLSGSEWDERLKKHKTIDMTTTKWCRSCVRTRRWCSLQCNRMAWHYSNLSQSGGIATSQITDTLLETNKEFRQFKPTRLRQTPKKKANWKQTMIVFGTI